MTSKAHPLFVKLAAFATIGTVVTIISMTTNFVALKFYKTPLILTYFIVYVSSIFLSFVMNTYFTFKSSFSFTNLIKYYLVYMVAMGIGMLLLKFYNSVLSFENWVYPFLVFPFTVPINFFMADRFLRKK